MGVFRVKLDRTVILTNSRLQAGTRSRSLPHQPPLTWWQNPANGGLPVRRVAVITAVGSAIGWILLGLASAIAVAWLTALD